MKNKRLQTSRKYVMGKLGTTLYTLLYAVTLFSIIVPAVIYAKMSDGGGKVFFILFCSIAVFIIACALISSILKLITLLKGKIYEATIMNMTHSDSDDSASYRIWFTIPGDDVVYNNAVPAYPNIRKYSIGYSIRVRKWWKICIIDLDNIDTKPNHD